MRPSSRSVLAGATGLGALVALALSLPGVWAAPVNVDEETTIAIAERSLGSIWHIVWGKRGGGPFHFVVEHWTLEWPGGLVGLRLPSVVFFLLALPALALVARELAGELEAAVAVLLLAAAPLAIAYASFGRPHVLLMTWILCGLWLGLRRRWLLAGLVLGASVFVHPIAPLYALAALAAALVYAPARFRALVQEAWSGVLVFAALLVPYYVHSLTVLRNRYAVGSGRRGRTYSGHTVFHDALDALSPGRGVVSVTFLVGLAGLALLARRRWRAAAVPVVMLAAPIVFFSFVPSTGRSALFFTRYMLPAVPLFLVLVAVGVVAVGRLVPRFGWPLAGALAVLLLVLEVRVATHTSSLVRGIGLGDLTAAIDRDAVLFGTTGTIGRAGHVETLSYGRPPVLVDRYLRMRVDGLTVVDDDACRPAVAFLRGDRRPRRGTWVFYAAVEGEADAFRHGRRVGNGFVVVRSRPLPPRGLLELGLRLRRDWKRAVPRDFKVDYLIRADETALRRPRSCRPLGVLGDPDISPTRIVPTRSW